jgi:branched-chain amino acid transport system permease protein
MIYLGALVDGLLLGGMFAGIAVGLSLVFGVANLLNVAHGAFIVLGVFLIYALQMGAGLSLWIAVPLAMLANLAFGWVIYRFGGLARISNGPLLMVIVFTFGLHLVIANSLGYVYGAQPRNLDLPRAIFDVWFLGDIIIPVNRVAAAVGGLALTIGVHLLLKYTKLGRAVRATRLDRQMASANGIDVINIYGITVGIGAAAAAFAGFLIALGAPIYPEMGMNYLVIAFAVAIIAGFGRIDAVILGGLLYGAVLSVMQVWLSPGLGTAVAFGMLFLLLLVRPQGLFGSKFY